MYLIAALTCLQAIYVAVSSLPPEEGLGEPLGLEEPPHVLLMDMSPDGSKGPSLTTKQKRVLFHPATQKMMLDQLTKDIMAYEDDLQEENRIQRPLPPGFIHPALLSHWGLDWEALGKDDEEDEDGDEELDGIFETLIKDNQERHRGKQHEGSQMMTWDHSFWHPHAIHRSIIQNEEEE